MVVKCAQGLKGNKGGLAFQETYLPPPPPQEDTQYNIATSASHNYRFFLPVV